MHFHLFPILKQRFRRKLLVHQLFDDDLVATRFFN